MKKVAYFYGLSLMIATIAVILLNIIGIDINSLIGKIIIALFYMPSPLLAAFWLEKIFTKRIVLLFAPKLNRFYYLH